MPGPVKDVDIKLESCEDVSSIQTLISSVKPDWPIDKLQIKLFNEGTSNTLFAVSLGQELEPNNTVLVRIFGYQTELYIDRDREAIYLWILNQLHFASEVYAKLRNGICYGYLPGSTVNFELLTNPKYFRMIAKKVAALHSLPIDRFAEEHIPDGGFVFDKDPCVLNSALKFVGLISDNLLSKMPINGSSNSGDFEVFPSKEYLIEEILFLRKLLSTARSPIRFCHNDLLFGNIVLSPKKDSVHFIDFEYCGFNHVCYEIANHFCEYAGMADYDINKNLSPEFKRDWVETYLHAFKLLSNDLTPISSTEIDEWLEEIHHFTLAAHLYWGIWSIVQSQRSKLAFDYTKYSLARLNEYKRLKANLTN